MTHIFIAALVVAASSTSADASPIGPDYGFDEVDAGAESAPEAPPNSHPDWLAELFEHAINPETGLNDERSTALAQYGARLPASAQENPEASQQPPHRKD